MMTVTVTFRANHDFDGQSKLLDCPSLSQVSRILKITNMSHDVSFGKLALIIAWQNARGHLQSCHFMAAGHSLRL